MENKQSNGGGIGFFGALQVAFIALKVAGVIRWSWLTVFSPAFLYAALVLIILVIAAWSNGK